MLALLAALLAPAAALSNLKGASFVRALEFRHRLRVCNAYAYEGSLDVYVGKHSKLTTDGPMSYKSCRDFDSASLKEGDKIDFWIGEGSVGTFSVAHMPENDATLLLVIHRHDIYSTAVSFESHMFAKVENSQIAIIDAYKGGRRSTPNIMDALGRSPRHEVVRFDSVVAVTPGEYKVALENPVDGTVASAPFVALPGEAYVAIRAGVDAHHGQAFPQDIMVFPQSDRSQLPHSGAARSGVPALLLLLALCLAR